MSVRYTATWYDVIQARQHHTHQSSEDLPAGPVRQGILPAARPACNPEQTHQLMGGGEVGGGRMGG